MSKYCRLAAQGLVLLGIAVIPWFFSGVQMPVRLVAMAVSAGALLLCSTQLPDAGVAWKAIRVPLLLLVCAAGLGAWQLTVAASDWSPKAAQWKSDFAASPGVQAQASPLSLYVPGTRRDLAFLVAAIASVALGAALFGETKPMLVLLSVVAATGFAVACSGLVERAMGSVGPYFQLPLPLNAAPFGPFLNRNTAGALLELSLAAAIGLTVWQISRIPRRTSGSRGIDSLQWFLMHVDAPLLVSFGALITISAGVIASLSRGTMIAAIFGTVLTFIVAGNSTSRRSFFWLAAGPAIAATALGVWVVQSSVLELRWDSILAGSILEESRWRIWRESLDTGALFQPFGSGLGTFYYAHVPFERQMYLTLCRNAENQYIETFVVGGLVGVVLLVALCGLIFRSARRMWRRAQTAEHIGLAAAATAIVAMQLVHVCFDFAWYRPAVMFPLAVCCGAIFRRATIKRSATSKPKDDSASSASLIVEAIPATGRKSDWAWGITTLTVLVAGVSWAASETFRSSIVERAELDTRVLNEEKRTTEAMDEAIKRQESAVRAYPDDGEAHLRLAELWVERYASEYRREMDLDPVMRLDSEKYAVGQFPAALHSEAGLRERIGDEAGLKAIREIPIVKANLFPALIEVRLARELCPLSPYAQMIMAQLCFLDEAPSNDAWYLERAERLAQGRPDWLFLIGQLHMNAARPEQACTAWKRAWTLSPSQSKQMMEQAMAYLSSQQILEHLLPDDPKTIIDVAQTYYADPADRATRRSFFQKATQLLDAADAHDAADEYVRGTALADAGKLDQAEAAFVAATRSVDGKPQWYLDLAAIRAALGQRKEAAAAADRYRLLVRSGEPKNIYLRKGAELLHALPEIDDEARRRCAELYLEAGANVEAAEVARTSITRNEKDAEAHVILGRALLNLGDLAGASKAAKRAEELSPERLDIREFRESVDSAIGSKRLQ
ncbi:MAG: tetratricopeptide repeat protein [Planctomycetia bacterium]|nr:tetratricopeptide repeat protein [Planctomycetia bacterium]